MSNDSRNRKKKQAMVGIEPEIQDLVLLCDARRSLNKESVGWSRKPLHDCNITGHWLRKKKWNYWNVFSNKYLFCIAILNFDYVASVFTYIYNYETKEFNEKIVMVPFGRGCEMDNNVDGNVNFKNKEISVAFKKEKEFTKVNCECVDFKDDMSLKAEFIIEHPEKLETINVVIPWDEKKFQFTSKQNCLPAIGTITVGNETIFFKGGETLASMDFGRGIWPRKTFWNWATCSGMLEDKNFGINLGAGWTDGTGMTENGILYDNKIHKISEDVIFSYREKNLMKPWRIKTQSSKRIDLEFTPAYDRNAETNMALVRSNMHQVFGSFSGKVVLDSGEELTVENIFGCVEEHNAKW